MSKIDFLSYSVSVFISWNNFQNLQLQEYGYFEACVVGKKGLSILRRSLELDIPQMPLHLPLHEDLNL